ncbi:uncharacterized protein LOC119725739 [Patiria miniata]|uniref:Uncharacterized protein n=1 Tax=Patiria miniata TaxID=46514 RepID=A0A913ZQ12_PATMI|nr:uncharacterized protein LOC119725739 [Patiria miniata]
MKMKLFLILATLQILIGIVTALECYWCSWSSATDDMASCKDPFTTPEAISVKNCIGSSGCLKSVAMMNDTETIMRGCSTEQECSSETCTGETCNYCCTDNRCNSAGAMTFNLPIMLISPILMLVSMMM